MDELTRRSVLSAGVAALWAWPRPDLPPGGRSESFVLPARPAAGETAFFASAFIDHEPSLPYVHCPSLCQLADGGLACAWYAGSHEMARDVAVWSANSPPIGLEAGAPIAWSRPRVVMDRGTARDHLDRFVDKIGNAVLVSDDTGRLWLVFVTIAVGGWSGSSLNACASVDGGASWTTSRRLALSPFFNISELVRAAPVRLDSGEIALPIYHECLGKFPEMLWLRPVDDRLEVRKSRLAGGRSFLQPALVPLDAHRCVALLRDHTPIRRLRIQRSEDGGRTWSPPRQTTLPNPDASVSAVRLSDGTVLIACNLAREGRATLDLVRFDPVADTWHLVTTLDAEPGSRFAYPFMMQDRRGTIHLAYSWKMRRIRHVVMNEAWILSQPAEPVA